jgi:hypothetical protein
LALSFLTLSGRMRGSEGAHPTPGVMGEAIVALGRSGGCTSIYWLKNTEAYYYSLEVYPDITVFVVTPV